MVTHRRNGTWRQERERERLGDRKETKAVTVEVLCRGGRTPI